MGRIQYAAYTGNSEYIITGPTTFSKKIWIIIKGGEEYIIKYLVLPKFLRESNVSGEQLVVNLALIEKGIKSDAIIEAPHFKKTDFKGHQIVAMKGSSVLTTNFVQDIIKCT